MAAGNPPILAVSPYPKYLVVYNPVRNFVFRYLAEAVGLNLITPRGELTPSGAWQELSWENLGRYTEAEVALVAIAGTDEQAGEALAPLRANKLWSTVPAAKNDAYILSRETPPSAAAVARYLDGITTGLAAVKK